jgi:hypothetical protein
LFIGVYTSKVKQGTDEDGECQVDQLASGKFQIQDADEPKEGKTRKYHNRDTQDRPSESVAAHLGLTFVFAYCLSFSIKDRKASEIEGYRIVGTGS